MKSTTIALSMAAVAAGQSIPPEEFNLPMADNNTQLGVAFNQETGDAVVVEPGVLFGKQITSTQPDIGINVKESETLAALADDSTTMMLVMIDPDAPSPDDPTASNILHWLATDMSAKTAAQDFGSLQGQAVLTNSTPNAVPFAPPGPPATSAAHRYLLFLFQQPEDFEIPEAFAQFNAETRTNFDLAEFMDAADLEDPVAVNFMYVSGQEVVPMDFQGEPFGEFPGGNGNAIGLPGSTAGEAGQGGEEGQGGEAPAAPVGGNGTGAGMGAGAGMGEGGVISATPGMPMTGMGIMGADGSCTCNAACPAGSFPEVEIAN